MTDMLQVMDLVVNGPLKSHLRRLRCQVLFAEFQLWKLAVLAAQIKHLHERPPGDNSEAKIDPFEPSKTKQLDAMAKVLKLNYSEFATDNFRDGLVHAFVNMGLRADTEHSGPVLVA